MYVCCLVYIFIWACTVIVLHIQKRPSEEAVEIALTKKARKAGECRFDFSAPGIAKLYPGRSYVKRPARSLSSLPEHPQLEERLHPIHDLSSAESLIDEQLDEPSTVSY